MQRGFLGIDAGTQGLTAIFVDEDLQVLAAGDGHYDMVPNLAEGCYEQNPADWERALEVACQHLWKNLQARGIEAWQVLSVGISGQMHGEVLTDEAGTPLAPARLWCDSRNESEAAELTELLRVKMPKRITAARWLWTLRHRPELAARVRHLTTPGGWLAFRLTGQWHLGIGDAAGMFPIDQTTLDYDQERLKEFDCRAGHAVSLRQLLPTVCCAGVAAGELQSEIAARLGLPAGIPVAPAEGDQPAALTGSLIGEAGMIAASFGTSVCANSVGDRPFQGVSNAVDHFCAPDGKPINMVWLRNGTTYLNRWVELLGGTVSREEAFGAVIPQLLQAPPDCGGLLAWPFVDDEPGLGVSAGNQGRVWGLGPLNATPGNIAKAALLSTMFNLKLGSEVLEQQGFPRKEIILTGGLTKTPELGQLLADVFNTPVAILDSAAEGSAWGAAVLAKYRYGCLAGKPIPWTKFLAQHATGRARRFAPEAAAVAVYAQVYRRYRESLRELTQPAS